ncbi:prolipoprotein diacylglyceryl transferase [Lachnospiraceae bacterium KM106-2]|nr:prolipoprotein diacylglyceryl transferase [Lachnospiraceae bacterium KM106-2]
MFLEMSIGFPHLGIYLNNLKKSIHIFGIDIAFYGIIIACGMAAGYLVAEWQAKKTNQNTEDYIDFALIAIVLSVIGARLYFVIFNWSYYFNNPIEILDIRGGGLGIYGGVITAVITCFVFTKIKKLNFWLFADTGILGLLTGQIIGRWGNFFNREAFGDYTNGLFAMQLQRAEVSASDVTQKMMDHVKTINGIEYIQVHPTFLYESCWNLLLLIGLILYSKKKKFDGEIISLYLIGYGIGRLWIEGLRTDQLLIWGTSIPISQLVSIIAIATGITIIVYNRKRIRRYK